MPKTKKQKSKGRKADAELARLQKLWKKAEVRKGATVLPDGEYEAKVVEVTVAANKNGKLAVHWTLEVVDGDCKGSKLHKWDNLSTEDNLSFLKGTLEVAGVDMPDDIIDLPEAVQDAIGKIILVRATTKNDYQNVYFNEALGDAEDEEADEEDEDEDEDEEDEDEEEDEDDEDDED